MKFFTSLAVRIKTHPKLMFALYTALFYILIMILYFYFIHADLSTAPDFVYNQF